MAVTGLATKSLVLIKHYIPGRGKIVLHNVTLWQGKNLFRMNNQTF